MSVTTKSNSYITTEVIVIALKFMYYFIIIYFFLPGQKMLKEKKSNIKQEYKWLHTKYLSFHPVSYWQNIICLFFTSILDTCVFSHLLSSPGGRDGLCGCPPAAAECRGSRPDVGSPSRPGKPCLLDHTHSSSSAQLITEFTNSPGEPESRWSQTHFDSREARTQVFQVPGKCPLGCYKGGGNRTKCTKPSPCLLATALLWRQFKAGRGARCQAFDQATGRIYFHA